MPTEPTSFELALPDLRNKVVNRLIEMNWRHAHHAWERRRRDPIGAHVIALFYAEPATDDPPRCDLRTCMRLFLGADEQRLPRLLYELAPVIHHHLQAGQPLTEMANHCDPMSTWAGYVGVGVSSLDTSGSTWQQAQQTASSELDVPGRCYAVLLDGTRLVVDRLARQEYGEIRIWSTHALADVSGQPLRRFSHLADPATDPATPHRDADPEVQAVWEWLGHLHTVIVRGLRGR